MTPLGNRKSSGFSSVISAVPAVPTDFSNVAVGFEDEQPVSVEDLGDVERAVLAEGEREGRPLVALGLEVGSWSSGSLGSNSPTYSPSGVKM